MKNHFGNTLEISVHDNTVHITGELTQGTVMAAHEQVLAKLPQAGAVCMNLSGVTRCDSTSLALLMAFIRICRARSQTIEFFDYPFQMQQLIQVSGLAHVLATANNT